jgi:hypothetical protein
MHGIAYDAAHDEIVVPVALAGAILVFRGAASGSEPPLRVIQGQTTQIMAPDTCNIDVPHGEIVVGDPGGRKVLVFPWDANGNVPPLRVIQGQKTKLGSIFGIASDPVRNLILVGNRTPRLNSVLVFNRMDTGDVAPRAVIGGPKTGIILIRQVEVDAQRGKIYVAVKNNVDSYNVDSPMPVPWRADKPGFVGVWDISDDGDVPPRAIIGGPNTGLIWPAGLALDPANGDVFVIDSVSNGLTTYHVPEFYNGKKTTAMR